MRSWFRSPEAVLAAIVATAIVSTLSRDARAVDLPAVGGSPVKLDVTETSIVAQRFQAREGENPADQGYFAWLNRLNLVFGWKKLTIGARIDSSFYLLRPQDRDFADAGLRQNAIVDGATRYRDAVYPAKLWLTYKTTGLEVTAGDSYVQFGRGLVLSLRKVDELGLDTTLFGGKVTVSKDPFAFTLIGGQVNPARVDEPTGRALFLPTPVGDAGRGRQPIFGSDRIVGAQVQAGRGLPVSASTHAVMLTRCSPYSFRPDGTVDAGFLSAPFGTCAEDSRQAWLDTLPTNLGPVLDARRVINAGQSVEIPSLWGHGNLYLEGAVQRRELEDARNTDVEGNALYGSLVLTGGPVSSTLEVKSYRNFYPLAGSVNISRASAFANVAYAIPPTAEPIIQDSMFGQFNVCATGGRNRLDYRFTPTVLAYGTFGFFETRSEIPGASCDRFGRSTADEKAARTNDVTDASVGVEWRFDDEKSIVFVNVSGRNDVTHSDLVYYRELATQYSVTKYIKGPFSFELAGRHRWRSLDMENLRDGSDRGEPWVQGEHYNALKVAPKWVLSQGFEYTTFLGLPTYYFNGTVLYRFTSDSNIRIYVGQNRGGLRCVSGICRLFPAFSGARVELTLRF